MSISLIVENINTTRDTSYYPIQLKAGLAKIFTVSDTITCLINDKFIMCNNPPLYTEFEHMPLKYSAKFNIGYELNQLADQDGNVEHNCTKAFVNQISISESFTYNECAESSIDFDNLLKNISQELLETETGSNTLVTTKKTVTSSFDVMLNILNNPSTMAHFIINTKILRYIDEESGTYKINKIITRKLYQSSIVNLDGGNFILDTLSLETDKSQAFGVVNLEIKSVNLIPIITLADENTPNVSLITETDCIV